MFGRHSFILGEFKTAVASRELMEEDFIKLGVMGKKAVDSLFKAGYPQPVVLIHGRGMEVDIYTLSLRAEALYQLDRLGTFGLIINPYQFPLLASLGPLISARKLSMKLTNIIHLRSTFEAVKTRNRVQTNKAWMRGTFDGKPVKLQ
ncbi:hypothetical protein BCR41DRAFT_387048 [Lobosporangium transversale]|uniref:Uncharacterized protein n=1 Tax=Lobosporangium transversale TaxID=64571 RepID=A0A1Y2GM64_9FUNG|nr:hypothetical protein BCR41DRAFT_387048 [Lobosporangium transversale]ORZ13808.1 hypothetical protein BCR41DRAFT_387048 [Lobosporangium transversale]|eukprot:XP_021880592.1 hypothetical protein BCR41DRAFT_387048 [Lobosporangium transversale]